MKNMMKSLVCVVFLLLAHHNANSKIIASLTFTRDNSSSVLGAGTVMKGYSERIIGFSPTGEEIVAREERISCSGCCFKSCPETYAIVKNDPEPPLIGDGVEEASVTAIDDLLLYALNEISNNNNSGTHGFTQAVVNEEGVTFTYYFNVSWNVDDEGKSTINVHRDRL